MLEGALQKKLGSLGTKTLSLGVTGLSGAGKTVFIGALTHALLTADNWRGRRGQGPLAQFGPFERGQLGTARIRDDIHPDRPQFPFRKVRDSMLGGTTQWPAPTEGISRLSIEINTVPQAGMRKIFADLGVGRVMLDIVDFPGEWLIDLPMLDLSFSDWSDRMLTLASSPARKALSPNYFALLDQHTEWAEFDEERASELHETWAQYLCRAVEAGLTLNQPGRHLRPDALVHSPVLRFGPLPVSLAGTAFYKGMAKRFEEYKRKVIRPFYRDHFARMDRQIVLVDVLRAIEQGQTVFDEMNQALGEILLSFQYSKGGPLAWLGGARTTHALFAATKADHVVRGDRANLQEMLKRMLSLVDDRNRVRAGAAQYNVMALASVQATRDLMTKHAPVREVLYGRPEKEPAFEQWDPGGIPLDMPPVWSDVHFEFHRFGVPPMPNALQEGFPGINVGKALDFLIGEEFL